MFSGGHYVLFFQAFIVPVLLIVDSIRSQTARRRLARPRMAVVWPPDPSVVYSGADLPVDDIPEDEIVSVDEPEPGDWQPCRPPLTRRARRRCSACLLFSAFAVLVLCVMAATSAPRPEDAVAADQAVATGYPAATAPLAHRAAARRWLIGTLGLTVGAAVIAIALAPSGSAPAPEGLAFLLFVGSSVHVASTGWFYTVPEVREHMRGHPVRYVWVPITLITGASAVAAVTPVRLLYWLLLPYFGWQFFHFHKQNLGIAALAAASRRVRPLTRPERRVLRAAGVASIAALVARPGRLQLPLPQEVRGALAGGPGGRVRGLRARGADPADAPAARRAARVVLRRLPDCAAVRAAGIRVHVAVRRGGGPDDRARAAVPAAHGDAGGGRPRPGPAAVAAGGAVQHRPHRRVAAVAGLGRADGSVPGCRFIFGIFLGTVMAHFVVDAGLWRMRAEFPRAFLTARLPFLVPAARQ